MRTPETHPFAPSSYLKLLRDELDDHPTKHQSNEKFLWMGYVPRRGSGTKNQERKNLKITIN